MGRVSVFGRAKCAWCARLLLVSVRDGEKLGLLAVCNRVVRKAQAVGVSLTVLANLTHPSTY